MGLESLRYFHWCKYVVDFILDIALHWHDFIYGNLVILVEEKTKESIVLIPYMSELEWYQQYKMSQTASCQLVPGYGKSYTNIDIRNK